jgi:hypothetical protein
MSKMPPQGFNLPLKLFKQFLQIDRHLHLLLNIRPQINRFAQILNRFIFCFIGGYLRPSAANTVLEVII